jgi:hypothetical protein
MLNGFLFGCAMVAFTIAFGLSSIFPDLAQIAAPIVCSGGTLVTDTRSRTGGTITSLYCVEADGQKNQLNAGLVGLVMGIELLVPVTAIGFFAFRDQLMPRIGDDDGPRKKKKKKKKKRDADDGW